MAARPSLRTMPPDRRDQVEHIRQREDESLVTASKAEVALKAAENHLAQVVAAQQVAIDTAKTAVNDAYREVVEAFGSRARAAQYLGISTGRLNAAISKSTSSSTTDAAAKTVAGVPKNRERPSDPDEDGGS